VSDKASVASDELFCPGIEWFKSVAIPRPPSVLHKKSSRQLSDLSIEEVLAFNKHPQVLSSGSMPQATAIVLCPGDSYEVARELSLEVGRLRAEAGRLIGEAEIVRARYDRMMDQLRLAER
jgi:CRISPR/Cas system-associated exonuclease Cas4 (RecB family)